MKTTTLLALQIGVALVAVAITVSMVMQIGPLTRQLDGLRTQITTLEAKRDELLRSNDRFAATATPAASAAQAQDAWLFVGRLNAEGQWAPESDGVKPVDEARGKHDFRQIRVTKNSQLYDSLAEVLHPPGSASDAREASPLRLVKAGAVLDVLAQRREASVGGGSLVWVKVSVAPTDLLVISPAVPS